MSDSCAGSITCQRSPWLCIGVHYRKLPGDDAHLCGIAKLHKEFFTVFPGEAKGTDVGDADSGHDVPNGLKLVGSN